MVVSWQELADVTVDRSLVDRVLVPYDRVDELHQASKADPSHIQASARIPSCVAGFLNTTQAHEYLYLLSKCQ
jgi:hypothetical protein